MSNPFDRSTTRRAVVTGPLVAGSMAAIHAASSASGHARKLLAPDLVLTNGHLLTMDNERSTAEAIAISDDRIVAVGSNSDVRALAARGTRIVDLKGRTVIPGLTDAHNHAIRGGHTYLQETYWLEATSVRQALALVARDAAERSPDEWVTIVGSWHPNQFTERRAPTIDELSAAAPGHPVYLQFLYDYALVNDKGIEALRLNESTTPPAPGIQVERDAAGKATGRLLGGIGPFNALLTVLLPVTFEEKTTGLAAFFAELNRTGVTGFIDDSAGPEGAYETLFALRDAGRLTLRAGYRVPPPAPGNEASFFENRMAFRSPRQSEGLIPFIGIGEILVFGVNDGTRLAPGFQASEAALAELTTIATLAATRRIPLEIHAYTDDAASQILNVFEKVNRSTPIRDLRWAMAHLTTATPATMRRVRALGMALSVQMGPYYEAPTIVETNGADVAARSTARMALDAGVVVAGGTDATRIGDFRVWPAIQHHVTGASLGNAVVRPENQRLTRMEALAMYTIDSVWLAFGEDDRGSLEPGKLADLAVLDRPYLRVPAAEIGKIRSELTLLGGEAVHDEHGWLAR